MDAGLVDQAPRTVGVHMRFKKMVLIWLLAVPISVLFTAVESYADGEDPGGGASWCTGNPPGWPPAPDDCDVIPPSCTPNPPANPNWQLLCCYNSGTWCRDLYWRVQCCVSGSTYTWGRAYKAIMHGAEYTCINGQCTS